MVATNYAMFPKDKVSKAPAESTTDEVVHILRTSGGGPLCHFETPFAARIAGTDTRIRHGPRPQCNMSFNSQLYFAAYCQIA